MRKLIVHLGIAVVHENSPWTHFYASKMPNLLHASKLELFADISPATP